MGGVTPRKGPLWPESFVGRPSFGMTPTFQKKKKSKKPVSYQKKGGRGHAHPFFFWYDNDSGHYRPFRITQPTCIS